MKLSYPVKLSAIKHEYDPKWEALATTLHLELPSGVDLRTLQHIYRRYQKPVSGESGEYHLVIREKDGGAVRRLRMDGLGTKTKDFALFAVVKKVFSPYDEFEAYLDQGHFLGDEDSEPEVIFEATLVLPESLLEQTVRKMDRDLKAEGTSMTITAGGTSVTLGKTDNPEA